MSSGSACEVVEVAPGRWYYLIEDGDAPRNAFDWREHATACGPFGSWEAADDHVTACHGNPGGMEVTRFEGSFEPDAVLARLIEEAHAPSPPWSATRT
ncbi:hypothetical protein ACTWJ8_39880 (plasmid) [Streptomyces sp. SDT5-1]|uniref:hypothetical protein n=1 Tax=Streptomyces sp. SDT5-1 TaxID=3406418 RepID=UPI003FD3B72B